MILNSTNAQTNSGGKGGAGPASPCQPGAAAPAVRVWRPPGAATCGPPRPGSRRPGEAITVTVVSWPVQPSGSFSVTTLRLLQCNDPQAPSLSRPSGYFRLSCGPTQLSAAARRFAGDGPGPTTEPGRFSESLVVSAGLSPLARGAAAELT